MQLKPSREITQLLLEWSKGDHHALDQLIPMVFDELRKIASSYLRNERRGHTLQPTALIHEAYLRLVVQDFPEWQSRTHFFGIAAQLMRQILVDHARRDRAGKRGGGQPKVSLEAAAVYSDERVRDLVALDDALKSLAALDERKCRVIELRFFGGLNVEETAEVLGISVATVGREQRLAQAWLNREIANRGEE